MEFRWAFQECKGSQDLTGVYIHRRDTSMDFHQFSGASHGTIERPQARSGFPIHTQIQSGYSGNTNFLAITPQVTSSVILHTILLTALSVSLSHFEGTRTRHRDARSSRERRHPGSRQPAARRRAFLPVAGTNERVKVMLSAN